MYVSDLDATVIELVLYGMDDTSIITTVKQQYNGIVGKQTILDSIDAVRCDNMRERDNVISVDFRGRSRYN